ncbi:MAG: FAD-dependent oxidoreductase [Deltaproteobacteria bacterium]|nr:FAD-dependent oxidoreductase [Deltaproteobacteria bacterium]
MRAHAYDLLVIGVGSGGLSSAILALKLGKKVGVVEKRKIGGDCTWYGCVPSKALIRSAAVAAEANHVSDYGLRSESPILLNTDRVMEHVRSVRHRIYQGETPEVLQEMGIEVHLGAPRFVDRHRIRVGDQTLSSRSFLISTGSSPFIPPVKGLDDVPYLTNETLFDLEALPRSMIILGGGPIGTEMASALNRLGVEITLVQRDERILPNDDEELVEILTGHLAGEGIDILTGTEAVECSADAAGVSLSVQNRSRQTSVLRAATLLVATGRTPNVEGLDLEAAGVEYSKQGIRTDRSLRTTASNIYACGDVLGSYKFSHIAEYHASVAVPNAVLPLPIKRKVSYRDIAWSTFTEPELAHAGLTEKEARERYGDKIAVYRYSYDEIDRARTDLADVGMSKFICDKRGKLIGIHILGERASDVLHEAQLAKTLGVRFQRIRSMIHIYPTYGDLVKRPATAAFADRLQNNFFVKQLRKLAS